MTRLFMAMPLMLVLSACSSGGGGNTLIDPANSPDALSESLQVTVGGQAATTRSDTFPAPSDPQNAPAVTTANKELQSAEDEEVNLALNFDTDAPLTRLFVKVVGAQNYSEINLSQQTARKAQLLNVDLALPENLSDGRFCVDINAQDANGQLFQPVQICITVESSQDDEPVATPQPSASATASPAPSAEPSPTPTPNISASPTPAATSSPAPSASPSAQPTATPNPTASANPAAQWDNFNWDQADWQ